MILGFFQACNLFKTRITLYFYQKMSHQVFVYGTLKKGEPNHYWLTSPENGVSKFIGEGITANKYPLIIATKYNIPFLLFKPGEGHYVEGEVYEVDDQMLSKLDILEDHPAFYVREIDSIQLLVKTSSSPQSLNCWVYFIKNFKPHLLENTYLHKYSSSGSHGLPYLESCNESTIDDLNDIKKK